MIKNVYLLLQPFVYISKYVYIFFKIWLPRVVLESHSAAAHDPPPRTCHSFASPPAMFTDVWVSREVYKENANTWTRVYTQPSSSPPFFKLSCSGLFKGVTLLELQGGESTIQKLFLLRFILKSSHAWHDSDSELNSSYACRIFPTTSIYYQLREDEHCSGVAFKATLGFSEDNWMASVGIRCWTSWIFSWNSGKSSRKMDDYKRFGNRCIKTKVLVDMRHLCLW